MHIDFTGLASQLLASARNLLPGWLPAWELRGHEFVVGDLAGNQGDSLSINVNTGLWADFSTGDKGGDLISLYAAIHRISQADAAQQLQEDLGTVTTHQRPGPKQRNVTMPVPDDVPRCSCRHYKYGKPSAIWAYRDKDGRLLGYVARYDVEDDA